MKHRKPSIQRSTALHRYVGAEIVDRLETRQIGNIVRQPDCFLAYNEHGRPIGKFPTFAAALRMFERGAHMLETRRSRRAPDADKDDEAGR